MKALFKLLRLLVVGATFSFCMAVTGCRSTKEPSTSVQIHEAGDARPSVVVSSLDDTRTLVILSHEPHAFCLRADRIEAQTNLQTFIALLKAGGVKEIVLESKIKLPVEDRRYYLDAFLIAGFNVSEFWVPIASYPGRWNVIGMNPSKTIK